jgi:hypothetical protein
MVAPAPSDDERDPWERLPDESALWFSRFQQFLMLGAHRSVRRVFKTETPQAKHESVYGHWYAMAQMNHWAERALAWDEFQAKEERIAAHEERLAARSQRRSLLREFGERVDLHLDDLHEQNLGWRNAAEAIKVLTSESRAEYNDLPTHKVENTVTVKLVEELVAQFSVIFQQINELGTPEERADAFAGALTQLVGGASPEEGAA